MKTIKKYNEFVNEGFFDWFKPKQKNATNVDDKRIRELTEVINLMFDAESLTYYKQGGKTRYYYTHVDGNPDEGELDIVINPEGGGLKLYINRKPGITGEINCSQEVIRNLYNLFEKNSDSNTKEADIENNPWDVSVSLIGKPL